MKSVRQNLIDRHLNIDLFNPIIDEVDQVVVFYLWNLSGQLIGYQQYRPFVLEKKTNDPRSSRYFTYCAQPTILVWGIESLWLRSDVLFVTEGVFDAARLIALGYPAVAVLSCNPKKDTRNWLRMLNRRVIAICDNDLNGSGKKLAKFGDEAIFMKEKDLGDSSELDIFEMLRELELYE